MEAIRQTLRASALNTRDLMQELKPVDVGSGDLPGQLASAADRFRRDSSIVTTFVCDLNDVQVAPRIGREILRIAQEALVNVRKHASARNVVLRFGADGDRWRLTVDDDGQGFEFAGRHTLDELDAARRGPVVIKERVRGLGGSLTIDSVPGRGTRLEVDVPRSAR
jgi:signal transduction histidine kinase